MSTPPEPIRLITLVEGKTIFKEEKVILSFYFHTGLWIVRVEKGEKKFEILFSSIGEFKKAIEKFKESPFEKKEHSEETPLSIRQSRVDLWKNNWKEMLKQGVTCDWFFIDPDTYPELKELYGDEFEKRYLEITGKVEETYTCDEFVSVMWRLMDDLSFSCELCVSTTGGYKDFFHCEKCLIEGGGFVVCLSCMEENKDGYKEHETDFPEHKMESPDKENLMALYLTSAKECME